MAVSTFTYLRERERIPERALDIEPSREVAALDAAQLDTMQPATAAPLTVAPNLETLPYHELATRSLGSALTTLRMQVPQLSRASMPHDDAIYALRKSVFRLRTRFDLFAHAFAEHPKQWARARDLLDSGYETIGRFKDLFDAQGIAVGKRDEKTGALQTPLAHLPHYEDKEVDTLREHALAWKKEFETALPELRKLSMKAEPLGHPLARRYQSRFFWGGKTHAPKPKATGVENLRRLVTDLSAQAEEEYGPVRDLKHLRREEQQTTFHDFRKRMRVLLNVLQSFPDIAPNLSELTTITELVDRYGEIEDKIVALGLAKQHGRTSEAEQLATTIDSAWKQTIAWQDRIDIPALLSGLRTHLQ